MVATRPTYTLDDYVRVEEDSGIRHEFVDGLILATAGGSVEHGRLAVNVTSLLRAAVQGSPCIALGSDVRVGHEASDFRAYPDASVVCGEPSYAGRPAHTVTNPVCIVEVLSESTAAYDQGEKLACYRSMASVRVILFVSQETRSITVHRRVESGFAEAHYGAGDTVPLPELSASIEVDGVYV